MTHLNRLNDFFQRVDFLNTRSLLLLSLITLLPSSTAGQLFEGFAGADGTASLARSPIFASDPLFADAMDDFAVGDSGSTWIRHIGGGGPGWQPFTSMGGSVPLFTDNGVLIIEGQGLVTNSGSAGGTLGVNRRFFFGDSLVGAGLWYDVNQSQNNNVFQQVAYSLEWFLNNNWTVRNNGYLPVGPRVRNVTSQSGMGTGGTVQFQNNNLIASNFNSLLLDDSAMRGIEVEIARSVGAWSGEVFTGYYNFQGKVGGGTNGIKGGVRGYVTPRLAGNITVSDDPLFGTNVYGGFTWFLGGRGGNAPRTVQDKLTIPVERNTQVVTNEVSSGVNPGNSIILTSGGQPITVAHVNSNAGGSNTGTFENPFLGLPPTQNANIVYLHGDSTFNNQSYDLNPNQRFLGEGDGNTHTLLTDQLGSIILPSGSGGVNRPVIQAVNGQFALNSAANTEISNVFIDNSGPGIRGGIFANAGNVNVNRTLITSGFTGIDISGGTGQFTFNDVTVTDPTDAGLSINGGSAGITFNSLSSITQGTGGTAVRVNGGHTGLFRFDGDITATNGDGLQLDNADGQYDFGGQVQLNGGDAGIDILGDSAGTFTFTDTTITDPTGTAFNVHGGTADVTYSGGSITQSNNATTVNVQGGHTGTLNFGIDIAATDGDGLQFDNADGTYNFNTMTGTTTLNGGDAGIDILGGSAGTFTFSDTTITDPTGTAFNVDGGSADLTYSGGSITQGNNATTVNVQGGHTGTLNFGIDITATNGDGLQFDNADGTYNFNTMTGTTTLNGGDAGIDIIGGSAGTFTFTDTTVTNPSGEAFNVEHFESPGQIDFDGSLSVNNVGLLNELILIDTAATGTVFNFNSTGSNLLVSNGGGGILLFDVDGDVNITTPTNITNSSKGSLITGISIFNGNGTHSFTDTIIDLNDNAGYNAGVEILGQNGTVTFTNLDVTTNDTTIGAVGILFANSNNLNVLGTNNNINSNGAAAIEVSDANNINLTFNNVTTTNTLNQVGKRHGIFLSDIAGGSLDVTGTTTFDNLVGEGIFANGAAGTFTFATLNANNVAEDGLNLGVVTSNTGIFNINSGMFSNVAGDGVRMGSMGGGTGGGTLNLFNTSFTNIAGFTTNLSNSNLSGNGNTAVPFSSNNGGGNTGTILFNGGADSAP